MIYGLLYKDIVASIVLLSPYVLELIKQLNVEL